MVQKIEGKIPKSSLKAFLPCGIGGIQKFSLGCYDHVRYLESGIISSFYIFTCFNPINIWNKSASTEAVSSPLSLSIVVYEKDEKSRCVAHSDKSCRDPNSNYLYSIILHNP